MNDAPSDPALARKVIKKAEAAAREVSDALRAIDRADEDPFVLLAAVAGARRALLALRGVDAAAEALQSQLEGVARDAQQAADRSKAQLMGRLDDALSQRGLRLSGRLPLLECGPLVIELSLSDAPELVLWYGPKIARLGATALDADKAAEAVAAAIRQLDGEGFADESFLVELRAAWQVALARAGAAPGERAPVVSVLAEMAAGRQSARWRADPTRSAYQEYTRVQFSHDLGRLRSRRLAGAELQLTVATRDQTKKPSDHLWIAGTHYAFVGFRSMTVADRPIS